MMRALTRRAIAVAVGLLLLPAAASAFGWRYVLFQEGQLIYQGPVPPVDLSYPRSGQPTPMMSVEDPLEGREMTAREFTMLQKEPHLVIIPTSMTVGGPARNGR